MRTYECTLQACSHTHIDLTAVLCCRFQTPLVLILFGLQERKGGSAEISPAQEMEIIIRAVCAIKLPTLTFDDNTRFRALMGDLFPGIAITDTVGQGLAVCGGGSHIVSEWVHGHAAWCNCHCPSKCTARGVAQDKKIQSTDRPILAYYTHCTAAPTYLLNGCHAWCHDGDL